MVDASVVDAGVVVVVATAAADVVYVIIFGVVGVGGVNIVGSAAVVVFC